MQHFSHSDALMQVHCIKIFTESRGTYKSKPEDHINANQYKHKKYKTWKIFILEISDKTLIFFYKNKSLKKPPLQYG